MSQQEQLHIETAESSNRQAGLATEQLQRMHDAIQSASETEQLLAECEERLEARATLYCEQVWLLAPLLLASGC